MKARALIPVAGLAALLSLAACHGTVSSSSTGGPVLTAPSMPTGTPTAPMTTAPMTTHPVPPTHPAHPTHRPKPAPTHSVTASCVVTHDMQGDPMPDPNCTPGAILTTSTANVCSKDWASMHREYFSKAQRIAAFAKYGIITNDPAGYGEYDHLIPLELGGSNSSKNLWPEQGSIPNAKDAIENALHDAVCSGKVSLAAAQHAIATDWPTADSLIQAP